ncbi:MAG: HD domain-containing protein [Mariprofundus sp.]|nr:HD domain-containing protein [Mariprofundus sp.]
MLRILVVEDQPAVREVVAEIAAELDGNTCYGATEVVQVASVVDAKKALTTESWQGLITDMSLGDGNALEMIACLHHEGVSLPPMILMSGFLTAERMAQAVELGVAHVLAKPFSPDLLLTCLQKLFSEDDVGVVLPRPSQSRDRLLPEMFDMDRRLGLVYRMFEEMPAQQDASQVCVSALKLAMEVVHGSGGYLALFERQKQMLVCVAAEGVKIERGNCRLDETNFTSLIYGDDELFYSGNGDNVGCWPGMLAVPYVALPVRLQGVSMGVLCLLNPAEIPLKSETRQILALLIKKLDTLLDNRAVHAALAANMRETLIALVRSLEARDRYTRDHSARVGGLSALLARDLGLDEDHIDLIRTGGLLHDIGKCGVPDLVLLKPGRYEENEFAMMKAHPAIGDNIMANMDAMVRERLILRHHHERYDGFGYPDRLAGEDIPFDARIVCVADAVDAMTTHRVYRQARPLSFCIEQLMKGSGTQFDPQVVAVAIAVIARGEVSTEAEGLQHADGMMPLSALISVKTEVRKYG